MRVIIFVDVVCPWCFIGKRRLERATEMRPDVTLEKTWRPFQLNPDMPIGGLPSDQFFAEKFGSLELVKERRGMVAKIGDTLGIDFAYDRIARQPNTLDAHRLIRFAAKRDRADTMVEALFEAHFSAGRDIGDRPTLTAIAGEIGLDAKAARDFLDSDDERDTILAEDSEARRIGVTGVPCYIFAGQYAVAGAQEPEFFLPIFDLAREKGAA